MSRVDPEDLMEQYIFEQEIIRNWKRPNWKKTEEYSFMEGVGVDNAVDRSLWYWQFLRRRKDYQDYFLKSAHYLMQSIKESYDGDGCPPIMVNNKGFLAEATNTTVHKFNAFHFPNPKVDDPDNFLINGYQGATMQSAINGKSDSNNKEYNVSCRNNEVLVKFNLDLSIVEQIEKIKEELVWRQNTYEEDNVPSDEERVKQIKQWFETMDKKYYQKPWRENLFTKIESGKIKKIRRQPKKWINYLRVLDARDYHKEKYEDIGLYIGSEGLSEDEIEDRLWNIGSNKLKKIGNDFYRQASEVGFNFPF